MPVLVVALLVLAGTGLVALGQRDPERRQALERAGGAVLVAGLVALGFVLARHAG